jgi:hypothetical protein
MKNEWLLIVMKEKLFNYRIFLLEVVIFLFDTDKN